MDILSIIRPEQLFTGDKDTATLEYRKLCSKWHPDKNPGVDPKVIAHINVLFKHAIELLEKGVWEIPGVITINDVNGKTFNFKYKSKRENDIGITYIGDNFVAFFITKDNADLYAIGKKRISNLKYANDKMKQEMSRFMPSIHVEHETSEHLVMIMKKTPDMFLLRDVLEYFDNKMDPKHVAWVVSRLYNICCYLKYAKIVHNGISIDSVFISPQHHTACLLGNWWFSAEENSKLIAVPSITANIASTLIDKKIAVGKIDLEMLRAVGLTLLGDIYGSKLLADKNIPREMLTWFRTSSSSDAFNEYETWMTKVLINSFGSRKFVKLDVDSNKIYTT